MLLIEFGMCCKETWIQTGDNQVSVELRPDQKEARRRPGVRTELILRDTV